MSEDMKSIAVVTGAASGIGRAVALALAAEGRTVAVTDLDGPAAQATVRAIESAGGTAAAFVADIAVQAQVTDLHKQVLDTYGVPDTLVNCAGWDRIERFLDNTPEFWARVVNINYLGTVAMSHAFVGSMVENEVKGRIVNVASDAGRVGSTGETVYAGAKGGVIAFTKSLAREVARYGITANCVSPGPTDTPLFHQQAPKMQEALIRAIPLRRLAKPEEIADAVQYFASPGSAFVTGQVLSVSGGLTMVD